MNSFSEKFSLKNKTAFVSGGVGLLGTEVAKAFAEAGAKTVILDINPDKGEDLINNLLSKKLTVYYEHFDITDLGNIDKSIEKLNKKYGHIDVWVNCAYPRTSDWGNKVEDLSLESWQKNVDMHLNSYSWISRKVCLIMKKQQSGSLINFGSIYGVVGNDFTVYKGTKLTSPMAYAAIKGGIINLTRYLASYFGKYNVRVNTICPGGILDNQHQIFIKNYSQKVPLKRLGRPEEIAGTVLFLASDAASYITGTTIMVDGGWTAI